jgi:hypothetical protein
VRRRDAFAGPARLYILASLLGAPPALGASVICSVLQHLLSARDRRPGRHPSSLLEAH